MDRSRPSQLVEGAIYWHNVELRTPNMSLDQKTELIQLARDTHHNTSASEYFDLKIFIYKWKTTENSCFKLITNSLNKLLNLQLDSSQPTFKVPLASFHHLYFFCIFNNNQTKP